MATSRSYCVSVDTEVCDGCGVCRFFCKPLVFETSRTLNRRGFYAAVAVRPEACNNCRLCVVGCPQLAVAVRETGAGGRP